MPRINIHEYSMARDSNLRLSLRSLLNRVMEPDGVYNLEAYKVPRDSTLKISGILHYYILKKSGYTLHKSIQVSETQKEEVWYSSDTVFYCKTGEIYEFFGNNSAESNKMISWVKSIVLNQLLIHEKDDKKAEKYYSDFSKFLSQILEYAPKVKKFTIPEIQYVIRESNLIGDYSCKHAAAGAYIMMVLDRDFNVYVGKLSRSPNQISNNSVGVYLEHNNKKYFHNTNLKDYQGYFLKADKTDLLESLTSREHSILNEMKRTEFLKKSKHDPRMERRRKYLRRKYNIVSVDKSEMVNYGHCKFTIEVGDYEIIVFIHKFLKTLRVYHNLTGGWGTPFKYDLLRSVLPKIVDESNLKVHCSCPDFKYRFAYWASKHGYKASYYEMRPAKIRNPKDSLGSACKHVLAIMSNKEWVRNLTPKVRKVIEDNPDIVGTKQRSR